MEGRRVTEGRGRTSLREVGPGGRVREGGGRVREGGGQVREGGGRVTMGSVRPGQGGRVPA